MDVIDSQLPRIKENVVAFIGGSGVDLYVVIVVGTDDHQVMLAELIAPIFNTMNKVAGKEIQ